MILLRNEPWFSVVRSSFALGWYEQGVAVAPADVRSQIVRQLGVHFTEIQAAEQRR